jgi:hypothetical protein
VHTGFFWGELRKANHFEDPVVDWKIIELEEVGWEDFDWIAVGQDRDRWRVRLNAVMNIGVP